MPFSINLPRNRAKFGVLGFFNKKPFCDVIESCHSFSTSQGWEIFPLSLDTIVFSMVQIQTRVPDFRLPREFAVFYYLTGFKKIPFCFLENRTQFFKCSWVPTWQDCLMSLF